MFPILILAGLAGFAVWAAKPKTTGVVGGVADPGGRKALPAFREAPEPEGFMGPPLLPEEERLLSLLVLWARDKKNPPGRKRYLNRQLAGELVRLAHRLGLRGTVRAVLTDGPVPEREMMGRRGITVRSAIVAYGTRGKLN